MKMHLSDGLFRAIVSADNKVTLSAALIDLGVNMMDMDENNYTFSPSDLGLTVKKTELYKRLLVLKKLNLARKITIGNYMLNPHEIFLEPNNFVLLTCEEYKAMLIREWERLA